MGDVRALSTQVAAPGLLGVPCLPPGQRRQSRRVTEGASSSEFRVNSRLIPRCSPLPAPCTSLHQGLKRGWRSTAPGSPATRILRGVRGRDFSGTLPVRGVQRVFRTVTDFHRFLWSLRYCLGEDLKACPRIAISPISL